MWKTCWVSKFAQCWLKRVSLHDMQSFLAKWRSQLVEPDARWLSANFLSRRISFKTVRTVELLVEISWTSDFPERHPAGLRCSALSDATQDSPVPAETRATVKTKAMWSTSGTFLAITSPHVLGPRVHAGLNKMETACCSCHKCPDAFREQPMHKEQKVAPSNLTSVLNLLPAHVCRKESRALNTVVLSRTHHTQAGGATLSNRAAVSPTQDVCLAHFVIAGAKPADLCTGSPHAPQLIAIAIDCFQKRPHHSTHEKRALRNTRTLRNLGSGRERFINHINLSFPSGCGGGGGIRRDNIATVYTGGKSVRRREAPTTRVKVPSAAAFSPRTFPSALGFLTLR